MQITIRIEEDQVGSGEDHVIIADAQDKEADRSSSLARTSLLDILYSYYVSSSDASKG